MNCLRPTTYKLQSTASLHAWTLIEMLMVITLLLCLAALTFPSWHGLQKKMLAHGSADLLLSSLEEARTTALQHHLETWVIFQHRTESIGDRFCIFQKPEDEKSSPAVHWVALSSGVIFNLTPKTIMSEALPAEVIRVLPEYVAEENVGLGAICYNGQGSIVQPAEGDDQLLLELTSTSKNKTLSEPIVFSRLTGRAMLLHH